MWPFRFQYYKIYQYLSEREHKENKMKLSEEIKKMMLIMGFENQESLPSMTDLRKTFIKLAVEKHPDKGGSEEEFKEMYSAYEMLGKIITSNSDGGDDSSEEAEAKKRFKEETWEEVFFKLCWD